MEYALLFLMMIPPVALAAYLSRRCGGAGHIDLGLVFAGIVFVYAWLPLLGLVLAQYGCGVLQDQRVVDDIPDSAEIVTAGASYLAFIAGFAIFYGWRRKVTPSLMIPVMSNWLQVLIISTIAGLLIFIKFLGCGLLGVGAGESYIDSYTQLRHLPLVVQQIMNGLAQSSFAASLAAMVFLMAWKPRLHRYVALAVVVLLLNVTFSGGSRTFGFLLAFSYMVCFSIYVQKIKISHLFLLTVVGLLLFIFAGILRTDDGSDALMLAPFQGGEFFSVFTNSVDLSRRIAEGGSSEVPWQIYWADLLRFVPQQFIGFEKLDPAVWYVKTYYPEFYDAGGGLAFGAIAESVTGFGFVEAFVRGGLLGVAYAFVANRCTSRQMTPMRVFVYVWFVVMSYQAIRDTTFTVFPRFVFQVLPVIVFLTVGYSIMRVVFRRCADEIQAGEKNRA
jgi:oligosaccharide repeat unit polymerase